MEKKREVEVEEYWRSKEQELGEPILFKSISHTYHSEGLESFGVLFASASFLVFEYSKSARRSILEVLFSRREQGLGQPEVLVGRVGDDYDEPLELSLSPPAPDPVTSGPGPANSPTPSEESRPSPGPTRWSTRP